MRFRSALLAAATVSAIALPTYTEAAGRVFYDGFEDGTTNAWQQYIGRNKCAVVTSALDGGTGPKSGSRMARCNWNGVVAWDDPASYETLVLRTWPTSRETLVRFWIRVDGDVDVKAGSKLYRWGGNLASSFGAIQFEQGNSATLYTYFGNESGAQVGTTNWGGGAALRDGKWHRIDLYLKTSQSGNDGAARVWVDGQKTWEALNVSTPSSYSWKEFLVMSNWSSNPGWEHDANNHVYWDEFEIFSDTGSGGTGSLADATIGGGSSTPPAAAAPPPPPPAPVLQGVTVK